MWDAQERVEGSHWLDEMAKCSNISIIVWHLREKANPEPEDEKLRLWSRFLSLPAEILNAPDPLDAIIKSHSEESSEDEL